MPVMSAVERAFCRSLPWRVAARRAVLPWVLRGGRVEGDVLEIGGGSGAMADGLARAYPNVSLTVTDIDDAMVRAARARLSVYRNVRVERADVTDLAFADQTFDMVASHLMLHHVIAWREALLEAARVLRPGGVFLGYDLTDTRLARFVHRADGSPHHLVSAVDMAKGLADAGFADVEIHRFAGNHLMRFRARKPPAG